MVYDLFWESSSWYCRLISSISSGWPLNAPSNRHLFKQEQRLKIKNQNSNIMTILLKQGMSAPRCPSWSRALKTAIPSAFSRFKMWLAFSTNWTAEPVFSKRLEMPCKKSSRWKRRFSGVLSALSIDRMYSVSCHPLNRSPFEKEERGRLLSLRPRSHRKDNLLDCQALLPLVQQLLHHWEQWQVLEMFVLVYLLEECLVNMEWDHLERQSQGSFGSHQGHEMAIPSISSRTGATIPSNPCQSPSIVDGVGILSVRINW